MANFGLSALPPDMLGTAHLSPSLTRLRIINGHGLYLFPQQQVQYHNILAALAGLAAMLVALPLTQGKRLSARAFS